MSVTNVYIPKTEFRFTGRPKVIRGGKRTKFVVEHIVGARMLKLSGSNIWGKAHARTQKF